MTCRSIFDPIAVVSALELTSRNIMCGSLRMVYAVIYTLFLVSDLIDVRRIICSPRTQGFGLSFGSDFYLAISKYGRNNLANTASEESLFLHGNFSSANRSAEVPDLLGTFAFLDATTTNPYVVKGACSKSRHCRGC